MRSSASLLRLVLLGALSSAHAGSAAIVPGDDPAKPRLVILADMGNEPDEEQQMAHMLVNCNGFHLEGLVAVTGKYLNENSRDEFKRVVHPELFTRLIDGYAKVEPNLRLHAKGWPSADYLHSIVRSGQAKYGLADTGPGRSSPGSRLIAEALERNDPRPLNLVVNAGSNTLAQALIDLRAAHAPERIAALVRKLRVFENGAQDNCGAWICHEFPEIHWIRSNHQTYGYMGQSPNRAKQAAGPHTWKPFPRTHQGQHRWAEQNIMHDHGALGSLYPYRFGGNGFLEGGGTIPWLGLVNKGLYDIDRPSWGGWSGRFSDTKLRNVWSRHASVRKDEESYGDFHAYTEARDHWIDHDGTVYNDDFAAIYRWRQAIQNNCQARFDWCVQPVVRANHHPVAAIRGDTSDTIVHLTAHPGKAVTLDASRSSDPDGDVLSLRWYFYPEAGTYPGNLSGTDLGNGPECRFTIPADAAGSEIHAILEVTDQNKIVPLTDYRRIVITVAPSPE